MMAYGKRKNLEIRPNGIEYSHIHIGRDLVLPMVGASAIPGLDVSDK